MALQKNFLYGRRQLHVVAVVLYIVCRLEKSPHLLIDFSDACQVNVYKLGHCFLQCIRILNIQMPIIDPSLYIHRYAQQMELGEKVNAIIYTALRTVTRLKKDWVHLGRRPDGVCAAALLIASRAHGFHKSQGEMASLFRVAEVTIKNRLIEFRATPAAHLPISAFHGNELENEAENDPPAFIRNKKREDDIKRLAEGETEEEVYGLTRKRMKLIQRTATRKDLYENIYSDLASSITEAGAATRNEEHRISATAEDIDVEQLVVITCASNVSNENSVVPLDGSNSITGNSDVDKLLEEAADVEEKGAGGYNVGGYGGWGRKEKASMRLQPNLTTFDVRAPKKRNSAVDVKDDDVPDPSTNIPFEPIENVPLSLEDDVIDNLLTTDDMSLYVLSADEQRKKAAIWERMHRPYLEEREKKRQLREREAAQREQANIIAAQSGQSSGKRKKQIRKEGAAAGISIISKAAVGDEEDDEGNKTSSKINYEALNNVFDSQGEFIDQKAPLTSSRRKKSTASSDAGSRRPLVSKSLTSMSLSQRGQPGVRRPRGVVPKQSLSFVSSSQDEDRSGDVTSDVVARSKEAAKDAVEHQKRQPSSPPDEDVSAPEIVTKIKKRAAQERKQEKEKEIAKPLFTKEAKSSVRSVIPEANPRDVVNSKKANVQSDTTSTVSASGDNDSTAASDKKAVSIARPGGGVPIRIPGATSNTSRTQSRDYYDSEDGDGQEYDEYVYIPGDLYDQDED